jgi:hypothetical protein
MEYQMSFQSGPCVKCAKTNFTSLFVIDIILHGKAGFNVLLFAFFKKDCVGMPCGDLNCHFERTIRHKRYRGRVSPQYVRFDVVVLDTALGMSLDTLDTDGKTGLEHTVIPLSVHHQTMSTKLMEKLQSFDNVEFLGVDMFKVRLQAARLGEAVGTKMTRKWPFTRMDYQVSFQSILCGKSPKTHFTSRGTVVCCIILEKQDFGSNRQALSKKVVSGCPVAT